MARSRARKFIQHPLLFHFVRFQISGLYNRQQFALAFQAHHAAPATDFFAYGKVTISLMQLADILTFDSMI